MEQNALIHCHVRLLHFMLTHCEMLYVLLLLMELYLQFYFKIIIKIKKEQC